jgi:hypothetical protein
MKIPFLAILLLISISFSWDWDTHQWFASEVCRYYNCNCMDEIRNGSIAPDRDFRDSVNHHSYDPSSCKNSSYYRCPEKFDDIAIQKMDYYLELVSEPLDCQDWYNIGVASHYYLDSKVIWHNVQNEDYGQCHEPFESKVGEYFKKGIVDFSVTKCGETVKGQEFMDYKEEYIGKLGYERKQESDEGLYAIMIAAAVVMAITVWTVWKYIQK